MSKQVELRRSPIAETTPGRHLLVWKIRNAKPFMPSIRYRCLFPLRNLAALGWESLVLIKNEEISDWSAVAALILVNTYMDRDVLLAKKAAAQGVPIVFDLCDNHLAFSDELAGDERNRHLANFRQINDLCRIITVNSSGMGALIAQNLSQPGNIRAIPDQVESKEETVAALNTEVWRRDARGLRTNVSRRRTWTDLFRRGRGKAAHTWNEGVAVPTPPREPGRHRIIWFGKRGFGQHGLRSLVSICPALARVNESLPIELLIASNAQEMYRELIEPFSFPTLYLDWHPLRIYDDIRSADLFVMPNSRDAFSLTKSANRAALALSLGVPVVATMVPVLEPLADAIVAGDWEDAICRCLTDETLRARTLAAGRKIVEQEYGGKAIAARWDAVLRDVTSAET